MSDFSRELKLARAAFGHKTARTFFDWLKAKGISFNYSYYMRLEQGGIPSDTLARELAAALKGEWTDRLILAYCRSLFPKNSYLFPAPTRTKEITTPASPETAPAGQKELTPKQVAAIAASEATYHLFLLATLARKPFPLTDLHSWFAPKQLAQIVRDLKQAQLVRETSDGVEAISLESKFPEAYNAELKVAYEKFDQWDESFGEQFCLEYLLNKMLVRRVSGRYLVIIGKQLDTLFELVRSADELDSKFNDSVLQLKVVLRRGRLPG